MTRMLQAFLYTVEPLDLMINVMILQVQVCAEGRWLFRRQLLE